MKVFPFHSLGAKSDPSRHSKKQALGTACVPCPAGRYKVDAGPAASCDKCGAGKYNEYSGSVSEIDCSSCGLGMYSAATGAATCSECERGTFADVTGMASCTPCDDPGEYTANTISSTSADCQHCPEGEYGDLALGHCAICSISEGSCILAFTEDLGEALMDFAGVSDLEQWLDRANPTS